MARQEIILGTPPQGLGGDPPRTASMKINAMTTELYAATGALVKVASLTDSTPGRLLTTGAGGILGNASPPASDCNAVRIGGKYRCANTPNAPIPDIGTLEVTAYTADWVSQTFRAVLPVTRVFERSWYGGTTWSPWLEVVKAGDFGVGGMTPVVPGGQSGIDGVTKSGAYYASAASESPIGYAFVDHRQVDANTRMQTWHDYAGSWSGFRFRASEVSPWGAFDRLITAKVVTMDPAVGGIMSSTVVNGYTVTKYASGLMNIMGPAGQTAVITANAIYPFALTIPSGFISTNFITTTLNIAPNQVYDHYGVTSLFAASATSIQVVIRNGAVAQFFTMYISVWGRWK